MRNGITPDNTYVDNEKMDYKMIDISYGSVAAAAESLEKSGQEPSVRLVRDKLGRGSNTTVTPLLRQWKEARSARLTGNVQLNPAISDLIIAQIVEVANCAANDSNIRVKEACQEFDELAVELKSVEAQLYATREELESARAKLLLQQGQLNERARENEELRAIAASKIDEADRRAAAERTQAETLRQELVRASIAIESIPELKIALENALAKHRSDVAEVAEARQAAAVAMEHAKAQFENASLAAKREEGLEAQRQRFQEQLEVALDSERQLRQEILRLTTATAALEARCNLQQAELEQLRKAVPDTVSSPGGDSES